MSLISPDTYVLITGASSGIGAGFAREFAKRGYSLVLTARREERLLALRQELAANGKVKVQIVAADLNANDGPRRIFETCEREGWRVGGLINNAGLGVNKSFLKLDEAQIHSMLQVNLVNLVELSRLFLPSMTHAKKGFVLNIASTAGFQPVPYFSVYAATKCFVVSFSEGLYEELKPQGVLVSCLCPGPTETEFQQVAGMSPRFFARSQSVDEIIDKGMRALERGKAVEWSSFFQRFSSTMSEILPRFIRRKAAAILMLKCGAE
ncbi:MAG: SDR family oxidoreductase [Verrucomicrobiales bacterium]|jgi:short-subunit dehydrogenase|nr:SDR family oxidoreductase [Verrucomicrobiales bacterium]